MRLFVACAILVAVATNASAEEPAAAASRKAFVSGMKHFDLGEFREALDDFKAGYRVKEDPVFLYNMAQSYRALGENKNALRYYKLYLTRASDAPNRAEVEQKIASLQKAVDADEHAASIPPSHVLPADDGSAAATAPGSNRAAATDGAVVERAPASTPVYKKWWLWTIVGVVVAGAAVGVGVGLTHAQSSNANWPVARF